MKYLILMMVVTVSLMAGSINIVGDYYTTHLASKQFKHEVKVGMLLAIERQKRAGALRNYENYDPNFRPYIQVINHSNETLKPWSYNVGSWHPKRGATFIAGSSLIKRVYDIHQVNYLMDNFRVLWFKKNGDVILIIK